MVSFSTTLLLLLVTGRISAFQNVPVNNISPLHTFRKERPSELHLSPLDSDFSAMVPSQLSSSFGEISSTLQNFLNDPAQIQQAFTAIAANAADISPSSLILPATILSVLTALSYPKSDYRRGNEPYLRGNYDPDVARAYYSQKPILIFQRSLQLFRLSNSFIASLLFDKYILRDTEKNIDKRAVDLLELIQNIGPTAIKVGQALSVRSDLIPAAYAEALSELQDNVPPFPSDEAKALVEKELGATRFRKLKSVDWSKPVASASIGQVYRGKATIGEGADESEVEIAIKVQRPDALSEIALDLFIVREFAPYYAKLTGSSSDLQGLANEWGRGFIAELTYEEEAANTIRFNEEMKAKNINAVISPTVVSELSTNRVLITEWVNGCRLDKSTEGDVARLCGVALNAYLVMLLETGTLHCDPHPGNLIRTDDGKLCILDFGMTLETPSDLQFSLLEFIAHLTADDYEKVPQDLVNLQFLKEEKLGLMVEAGLLEPLFYFLRQSNKGGGGTKVRERIFEEYSEKYPGADEDELRVYMRAEMQSAMEENAAKVSAVTGITTKVEDLQKQNADSFGIPEWFLYTSRAFLTLEGISLQADSDYSIIQSCFPYVAKRLIGDTSPRSQAALRDLIYGKDDQLNTEKISELADGFTEYTTTTQIVSQAQSVNNDSVPTGSNSPGLSTEATLTLAKDTADILLAPEGNLVQNILIEESATAINAQVKDALREALISNPERIRSSLPLGLGNFLPKPPAKQLEPFLNKSSKEHNVQALAEKFTSFASLPGPPSASELGAAIRSFNGDDQSAALVENMSAEEVAVIWKAVRENAPIYGPKFAQLGGKFAKTVLGKVSENIDDVVDSGEADGFSDEIIRSYAKGISSAAKQSANALNTMTSTESS